MSFRSKTILGIAVIEAILLIFLIWNALNFLRSSTEDELIKRAHTTVKLLATMTEDAVITTDLARLESFLNEVIQNPDLVYVRIYDRSRLLASAGENQALAKPFSLDREFDDVDDGIFDTATEIKAAGITFGHIETGITTGQLDLFFSAAKQKITAIAAAEMALTGLFSFVLGTMLVLQLKGLREASKRISEGDVGYQMEVIGTDELAETATSFNLMSLQLKETIDKIRRTDELTEANNKLQQEISERQQTEKILSQLKFTLDQTLDCVLMFTDDTLNIFYANQGSVTQVGYTMHELIGMTPFDFKPDFTESTFREMIAPLLDGSKLSHTFETTHKHKNGSLIPVEIFLQHIQPKNERGHFVAIIRDSTDRHRFEAHLRQSQKMQAVGTLAGGMAHEFNNLLAIIIGSADMAHDEMPEGSFAKGQLDRVLKASSRAKDLVTQILTFSSQKLDRKRSVLDLASSIRETLELITHTIPSSVELKTHIDNDCTSILADPSDISQILMNLCANAVWAMREKGVLEINLEQIDLSKEESATHSGLKAGQYLHLSVSDTGKGMDAATTQKVFDPFFTTKEVGQGTGMGLSTVLGIMKSYNGEITVESTIDKGTTFHLYLPAQENLNDQPEVALSDADSHPKKPSDHSSQVHRS